MRPHLRIIASSTERERDDHECARTHELPRTAASTARLHRLEAWLRAREHLGLMVAGLIGSAVGVGIVVAIDTLGGG